MVFELKIKNYELKIEQLKLTKGPFLIFNSQFLIEA